MQSKVVASEGKDPQRGAAQVLPEITQEVDEKNPAEIAAPQGDVPGEIREAGKGPEPGEGRKEDNAGGRVGETSQKAADAKEIECDAPEVSSGMRREIHRGQGAKLQDDVSALQGVAIVEALSPRSERAVDTAQGVKADLKQAHKDATHGGGAKSPPPQLPSPSPKEAAVAEAEEEIGPPAVKKDFPEAPENTTTPPLKEEESDGAAIAGAGGEETGQLAVKKEPPAAHEDTTTTSPLKKDDSAGGRGGETSQKAADAKEIECDAPEVSSGKRRKVHRGQDAGVEEAAVAEADEEETGQLAGKKDLPEAPEDTATTPPPKKEESDEAAIAGAGEEEETGQLAVKKELPEAPEDTTTSPLKKEETDENLRALKAIAEGMRSPSPRCRVRVYGPLQADPLGAPWVKSERKRPAPTPCPAACFGEDAPAAAMEDIQRELAKLGAEAQPPQQLAPTTPPLEPLDGESLHQITIMLTKLQCFMSIDLPCTSYDAVALYRLVFEGLCSLEQFCSELRKEISRQSGMTPELLSAVGLPADLPPVQHLLHRSGITLQKFIQIIYPGGKESRAYPEGEELQAIARASELLLGLSETPSASDLSRVLKSMPTWYLIKSWHSASLTSVDEPTLPVFMGIRAKEAMAVLENKHVEEDLLKIVCVHHRTLMETNKMDGSCLSNDDLSEILSRRLFQDGGRIAVQRYRDLRRQVSEATKHPVGRGLEVAILQNRAQYPDYRQILQLPFGEETKVSMFSRPDRQQHQAHHPGKARARYR